MEIFGPRILELGVNASLGLEYTSVGTLSRWENIKRRTHVPTSGLFHP